MMLLLPLHATQKGFAPGNGESCEAGHGHAYCREGMYPPPPKHVGVPAVRCPLDYGEPVRPPGAASFSRAEGNVLTNAEVTAYGGFGRGDREHALRTYADDPTETRWRTPMSGVQATYF